MRQLGLLRIDLDDKVSKIDLFSMSMLISVLGQVIGATQTQMH
jgi:hypothetical protein